MTKRIIEVGKQVKAALVPIQPMEIWDISGTFIVPGTRKKVGLSRVRVCAKDRMAASADMVGVLLEKFARDIPEGQTFSKQFAIYHLKWERFQRAGQEGPAVSKSSCEGVPDGTHCGSVQEHPLKEIKAIDPNG